MPHLDLAELIITVGYLGVFFMIFAENGLFFGLFFPGDSLLFTSGFLASQGLFNIYILTIGVVALSILGNMVGYWTGLRFTPWLMKQKDNYFFKKRYIKNAHDFYEKYGSKALVLARFVPTVRTFVPIVAGIAGMTWTKFMLFNVIGGVVWGAGMTLAGYFLGRAIPDVDRYLLPIILLIILLSITPGIIHFLKTRGKTYT